MTEERKSSLIEWKAPCVLQITATASNLLINFNENKQKQFSYSKLYMKEIKHS